MIIDSHLHLSIMKKGSSFIQAKQLLLKDMANNGIAKAIIIPDNIPNTLCADLDMVIRLTKNERKLLMVASLKIEEVNEKNLNRIKSLFVKKQALGFKIFPGHDPVYPTDKRWLPIFNLCRQHQLPLIIHTGINSGNQGAAKYNDPKYIIKLADNFKNLKIIIAHYFWPKLDYCFKMTQGYGNIYFDTSGLADPEVVVASGGLEKIKEILTKTIERKKDSIIFGTDWPMCKVKPHLALVSSLKISRAEKNNILYKNALSIFKIK